MTNPITHRAALAIVLIAGSVIALPSGAEASMLRRTAVTYAGGKKTVDTLSLNKKTDTVTNTFTITRADAETKTVTTKTTPDKTGGFNVSKSVTGFNGMTHSSTSQVGGKSGHAHA